MVFVGARKESKAPNVTGEIGFSEGLVCPPSVSPYTTRGASTPDYAENR